jgi:hypothetical protein
MIIQNPAGVGVEVPALATYDDIGNLLFVDLSGRAESMGLLEAGFISRGLTRDLGEPGVVEADGVNIAILQPRVITPGQDDAEGNQIVAPVLDDTPHFDVRLARTALTAVNADGYEIWKETLLIWAGGTDATPNASEVGKDVGGITLIDRASIATPDHGWGREPDEAA